MPGPDAAAAAAPRPGPRDRGRGPRPAASPRPRGLRRRRLAARRAARPQPADWDLATDARPERARRAVPRRGLREPVRDRGRARGTAGSSRSRRSGSSTSTPTSGGPHRVEFGDDLAPDLARRDFTVNAMAWGGPASRRRRGADPLRAGSSIRSTAGATSRPAACGRSATPSRGSSEDALRMIRAVRLGGDAGLRDRTGDAGGDRRARAAGRPPLGRAGRRGAVAAARGAPAVGRAAARWPRRACSRSSIPELAAQRGMPQNKVARRGPVGPHAADRRRRARRPTGRAPRRAPPRRRQARRPRPTGASTTTTPSARSMAEAILRRLRVPGATVDEVVQLVRQHMFAVRAGAGAMPRSGASSSASGRERVDALFALRRADNIGSGLAPDDAATAPSARASTPSSRPGRRSTGTRSPSMATT